MMIVKVPMPLFNNASTFLERFAYGDDYITIPVSSDDHYFVMFINELARNDFLLAFGDKVQRHVI